MREWIAAADSQSSMFLSGKGGLGIVWKSRIYRTFAPCWSQWIRGKQGVLQYSLLLILRRYKVHLITLGGCQVFPRIPRLPVLLSFFRPLLRLDTRFFLIKSIHSFIQNRHQAAVNNGCDTSSCSPEHWVRIPNPFCAPEIAGPSRHD